jgi:spore coat protein CotH
VIAAGASDQKTEGASPRPIAGADELFSHQAIPRLELRIAPDAMAALDEKPRKHVPAELTYAGTTLQVGVRMKGHRAMRGWDGKPALKIDFDRYVPGQKLFGLASLTLNNLVEDPTMVREALAYRLFREAGVPAPRTGYVELAVNGRPFGLYLNVESLDDAFLTDRLGKATSLYEGEYGCDLYPDDVWGFDQDAGEDRSRDDLTALAAAASERPASLFSGPSPLVDTERVLAYLATSALVGDFDGYRHSHNYRLARDPKTGRWLLLPWGLDRTFKKRLDPHDSGGLLAKLCFADTICRAEYDRTLVRLARRFAGMDLTRELDALLSFIDEAAKRDPKKPYDADDMRKRRASLREFLVERWSEVERGVTCLDGNRELDRDGDGAGCLDCDDRRADVHPGAVETCDRIDNDCSGLVDDAPACGCPAVTIGARTMHLCDLPMVWTDAAAFCEKMGMTLARIDSRAESRALYDAATAVRKDRWWIGLNDRAGEGTFVWHDGSPVTFTRWSKHQPDNDTCNEDCVALKDGGKGRWHDTHCGQRRPFVCAPRSLPIAADESDIDPTLEREPEPEPPAVDQDL